MKSRFIIVFLVIGAAVGLIVYSSQSNSAHRTEWWTFNRDSPAVMNAAGFSVFAVSSGGREEISVPFRARINAWLPFHKSVRLNSNEMEPTTLRIVARREGRSDVRCLARYHEGYIAIIVLRYPRGSRREAEVMRDALHAAYPGERIKLEEEP